jgi:hypothetical protein
MNFAGSFVASQSRMIARLDDWNMIANRAGSTHEGKIVGQGTENKVGKMATRLAIPCTL